MLYKISVFCSFNSKNVTILHNLQRMSQLLHVRVLMNALCICWYGPYRCWRRRTTSRLSNRNHMVKFTFQHDPSYWRATSRDTLFSVQSVRLLFLFGEVTHILRPLQWFVHRWVLEIGLIRCPLPHRNNVSNNSETATLWLPLYFLWVLVYKLFLSWVHNASVCAISCNWLHFYEVVLTLGHDPKNPASALGEGTYLWSWLDCDTQFYGTKYPYMCHS